MVREPDAEDPAGRRPPAPAPRATRRLASRTLVAFSILFTTTCLLFLILNVIAFSLGRHWNAAPPAPQEVRAMAAAHPDLGEEDLHALMRESLREFVADPFVQAREAPVSGRFVNVAPQGFRAGLDQGPWPPRSEDYNIFFFGGSTSFGYGVADHDTIPSRLQAALRSVGGRPVRVYNLARGGYDSTQERIQFDKWVSVGPRPDLAIFLDGLNDSYLVDDEPFTTWRMTAEAEAEVGNPLVKIARALPLVQFFLHRSRVTALKEFRSATARRRDTSGEWVVDRYLANRDVIEALGRAYDVRTIFVWQPVPMRLASYGVLRSRMPEIPRRKNLLWCAHVGDDDADADANYVDSVHYAPSMSDRVARCIADGLRRRGLFD